ncbi:FecR family protein [Tumidithrix elongata RA019]|uniref:FecR family protein n=1 Tax=Tumidithrix elongata BACA0141 TaxID=2716417 RepID=A0AAW9PUW9_9CYAN|nr:FecR family protein [Tumidithrix elongata RA019]
MKRSWLMLVVAIALLGCDTQPTATVPSPPTASSTPTPTPTVAKEEAIAKVSLIEENPVFVRTKQTPEQKSTPSKDEIAAKVGMGLHLADIVRTQGKARTQVDFNNGVAFRIGGDSVLEIQPQNRLHLTSGEMITWVQPGLKVPTEISTPLATASIQGTTAYVEIPKDINQGIRFFSWEGTVSVRLANQSQEIILLTGEEVIVKPNSTILPKVRRLGLKEWTERSKKSRFLRSFNAPLPTQSIIDKLVPGQASPDQATPAK